MIRQGFRLDELHQDIPEGLGGVLLEHAGDDVLSSLHRVNGFRIRCKLQRPCRRFLLGHMKQFSISVEFVLMIVLIIAPLDQGAHPAHAWSCASQVVSASPRFSPGRPHCVRRIGYRSCCGWTGVSLDVTGCWYSVVKVPICQLWRGTAAVLEKPLYKVARETGKFGCFFKKLLPVKVSICKHSTSSISISLFLPPNQS